MLTDQSAHILGEDGPFVKASSGFVVRESQTQMAQAIEDAIGGKSTLIAESGTGTGKTFAYLVPALLANAQEGKKTLISTGTKHLQEQLFYRDIPFVVDKLAVSAKVSLLKGRSNYLCLQRLQQAKGTARKLDIKQMVELEEVSSWLPATKAGDIAELKEVPEDSRLWPLVTSTVDNCLGQGCAYFDDCYVNKARKRALSSDVVVINHHLFFADKALKEDGFGALLPTVDTVIFDEAHQIPDIASNFLGDSFSSWQVVELSNDVRLAEMKEKSLTSNLLASADALDKLVADYRLSLGLNERRIAWQDLVDEAPVWPKKLASLTEQLQEFAKLLERSAVAGEALTRCHERALELVQVCGKMAVEDEQQGEKVRWLEIARRSFRINETPLNVGNELSAYFNNNEQARIFTSATLSINNDFKHYQQLMGLPEGAIQKRWDSPFDYYNQGVLYVPEGLPEPKHEEFTQAFFDAVLPLLNASLGRAFVLFTSFKIMQQFEELLSKHDFTVFMQGETNKSDLLKEFCEKPRPVLLGTMSFWEGVDVPGDKLSCVIIDKLPFESPFDPVLQARLSALQKAGTNPFMTYQVPRAVITLRQGAGRLIRSQQDKGVLMIGDNRLRGTHYGKIFLNSLPSMRRTSNQEKVCGFLQSLNKPDVKPES